MKLPAGTIKRLHVDRRIIANNKRHGRTDPPITVQTSKGPHKAMRVAVYGKSEFVYRPEKPLSCGAVLWVETTAAVELFK